jgi:precorrin-6B methylase 2
VRGQREGRRKGPVNTYGGRGGQWGHRRRLDAQKLLLSLAVASLAAGACGASSTGSPPSASASASTSATASARPSGSCKPADPSTGIRTSPSIAAGAEAPALLVLADCVEGGLGLWKLDGTGAWTALGRVADGQAIARDGDVITIAHPGSLETRSVAKPGETTGSVPLKWSGSAPSAPIVAIDRSPSGSTALVAADAKSQTYAVAAGDGSASQLQGAPTDSFTPLVGWIDSARVLALSQGTDDTSRIVVVNASQPNTDTLAALTDIRWFALSQDRLTVAMAKESGIYLGSVSALIGGAEPARIASVDPGRGVWNLVLDETGTHLAMLSGTVAADGTMENIREIGYTKTSSGWAWTYDSPVPFTRALGQVWLG